MSISSKYDVFISFRGADVRDNFLSHIVSALERKKIKTFTDENLARGVELAPSLLRTIENSRISIVIFSQHYADSPWCLDELAKIYECKETRRKTVIPIFYRVDPSDVKDFGGNYGSALRKHIRDPMFNYKVDHWKLALENIGNLCGFHSDNVLYRPETKLIEEVVKHISEKLSETTNDSFMVGAVVGLALGGAFRLLKSFF